jgi:hypothetical protein
MSSILEQAIIDAKLIKEAAKKNAEAAILEHYAEEIKQNIDTLLEEEDPMAGLGADPMASAPSGDSAVTTSFSQPETPLSKSEKHTASRVMDAIPPAYLGEDNMQEIEINLDSLVEKISKLPYQPELAEIDREPQGHPDTMMGPAEFSVEEGETQLAEVFELDEDTLLEDADSEIKAANLKKDAATAELQGKQNDKKKAEEDEKERVELQKKQAATLQNAVQEEMVVDMKNVTPGGINSNEIELKKQKNVALALKTQNKELEDEKRDLEEALVNIASRLETLQTKYKATSENNATLAEGVQYLTEKVKDLGVMNSRLLYINKILRNSSLNERQKESIVESISKAGSVEEAKVIFETLQKSAGSLITERKAPQSLTEAVSNSSSPFVRRTNNQPVDPTTNRWKLLAGIK